MKDKKEEFKLSDSMKIWCATKEYATKVQEKLSSMGCKWAGGNTRVWHPPMNESGYAIYCCNGRLTYGTARDYFEDQEIDEYILDEKINEIVKLTVNTEGKIMPEEKGEDVKVFAPQAEPPLVAMKIMTNNQIYCEKVQKKLFELGYWWRVGGFHTIQSWGCYGLEVDAWGDITFEQFEYDFNRLETVEYVLDEATDTFVIKSSVNNIRPDAIGLDCLFNQIVLLQKETDTLSEQKEQIVNKISAKTTAINILKEKMLEKVCQVGLVFVGNDNAEVVKDEEPLEITDWRDLKIGDSVNVYGEDSRVCEVEPEDYDGDHAFAVGCTGEWVDTSHHDWKFVSRPK